MTEYHQVQPAWRLTQLFRETFESKAKAYQEQPRAVASAPSPPETK